MRTREEKMKDITSLIETEESKLYKKKLAIKIFKTICILSFIVAIAVLYTHLYATTGLLVKENKITNSKIPESFRGSKLIQFSDLHYGSTFFDSELKSVVKKINKRKPDIVVFTGDLINKNYKLSDKDKEKLIKTLNNIDASLGKYAIFGEEDNDLANDILLQSNFKILNNNHDLIYNNSTESINIVGIASKDNINEAFTDVNTELFTICLLHEPDKIDNVLKDHYVDLALAGHSHNGQIKVFIPLMKKRNGTKYFKEYYKINDTKLYVSSGLGTSNVNFRFGAHPSINFFRLYNN